MQILKYIILLLIFLNIPTFGLSSFGPGVGSASVLILFGLIFLYFFLNKKEKPIFPFIFLGLCYFLISGINFSGILIEYFKDIVRYFLFILLAIPLIKKSSNNEIGFVLLIGAISVLINAFIFPNTYGRYSGFYLNPNTAGLICLIGFALSYNILQIKYRLIAQFLLTVAGIMTFSRYFILILILVNLVSILANKKNVIGLIVGSLGLIIILGTTSLKLNTERFLALKSIFSDDIDTETITKESRDETWSLYTEVILNNPIFGKGYKTMQGKDTDTVGIKVGVHNSYLMVLGESGIITLLLFVFIYLAIFIRSIMHFSVHPEYTYLAIILLTYLLVSHNLFDNYIVLFISIWLYIKVKNKPVINSLNQI